MVQLNKSTVIPIGVAISIALGSWTLGWQVKDLFNRIQFTQTEQARVMTQMQEQLRTMSESKETWGVFEMDRYARQMEKVNPGMNFPDVYGIARKP